jgi:hypothetical protein
VSCPEHPSNREVASEKPSGLIAKESTAPTQPFSLKAVEPVHETALRPQPAAAVDPWDPLLGLGHEVGKVPVIESLRESAQLPDG